MGIVGDIFGGFIGSKAAKSAARAQEGGAQQAQALIAKQQQDAIDFQKNLWTEEQGNQQPYLDLGKTSANSLASLLSTPFHAPTLEEAKQNPGYQFALESGTTALDKSAAARGDVFSGTQGTALQEYGQRLGEQNYNDVYARAMNDYMTRYNTLLGGTQVGQTATGQYGQEGQAAATGVAGIDLTGAKMQAEQINNAAAARASGYYQSANAWRGALSGADQHLGAGLANMYQNGVPWWVAMA